MEDKEIERGFHLVIKNAESLISEAKLLFKYKYFARAYSLTQLAIEEIGKSVLICRSILEFYMGVEVSDKYFYDLGFRIHQQKTKQSLKLELINRWLFEQNIEQSTRLKNNIVGDFKQIDKLNSLKNNSLYVSIIGDIFVSPSDVINLEMVIELLNKADLRLACVKPLFRPLSEMKLSAERLKLVMNNPEEYAKLNKRASSEFGIEFIS